MQTVSVSGSLRGNVGKKDAKANRTKGSVPCVLYGGEQQVHFTVEFSDLRKIIYTPNVYVIKLEIGGSTHEAIIQDTQFHPVSDDVLHIDFLEVLPGKPVTVEIPIKLEGAAKGVIQRGGVLVKSLKKITTRGLVEYIPDEVVINVTKVDLGQAVKIKDIRRDNLTFIGDPNQVIAAVRTARASTAVAGGEAEAEASEAEAGEAEAQEQEAKAEA